MAPGLASDPAFRARLDSECRLAAAIDHPQAVEVFHAGEADGLLYVTMRYVDGADLRLILRAERRSSRSVRCASSTRSPARSTTHTAAGWCLVT